MLVNMSPKQFGKPKRSKTVKYNQTTPPVYLPDPNVWHDKFCVKINNINKNVQQ